MLKKLHLVTTAFVGGQTGKSTFSIMLASYLCHPNSGGKVVVLIDASYQSALYENLKKLFANLEHGFVGGYEYFSIRDLRTRSLFVSVRPEKNDATSPELTTLIDAVVNDFQAVFEEPVIDHLICETNLPQGAAGATHFVKLLLGVKESNRKLHMWTTWNTTGVTNREIHLQISRLFFQINDSDLDNITWSYIHNPFASPAGLPENSPSLSMKSCFELELDPKAVAPESLWEQCGKTAYVEARANKPSEKVWESAYGQFLLVKKRPFNILPVYRSSKNWGQLFVSQFNLDMLTDRPIQSPADLHNIIDELSDKLLSEVFIPYFETLREISDEFD